jgi:hypothetical protein
LHRKLPKIAEIVDHSIDPRCVVCKQPINFAVLNLGERWLGIIWSGLKALWEEVQKIEKIKQGCQIFIGAKYQNGGTYTK